MSCFLWTSSSSHKLFAAGTPVIRNHNVKNINPVITRRRWTWSSAGFPDCLGADRKCKTLDVEKKNRCHSEKFPKLVFSPCSPLHTTSAFMSCCHFVFRLSLAQFLPCLCRTKRLVHALSQKNLDQPDWAIKTNLIDALVWTKGSDQAWNWIKGRKKPPA